MVAIELKLGSFDAAYKGQMELYLRWLYKYERRPGEEPPIGLILCGEENREQIELLQLDLSEISVGEYPVDCPPEKCWRPSCTRPYGLRKGRWRVGQRNEADVWSGIEGERDDGKRPAGYVASPTYAPSGLLEASSPAAGCLALGRYCPQDIECHAKKLTCFMALLRHVIRMT